jgi:hypothetical protein
MRVERGEVVTMTSLPHGGTMISLRFAAYAGSSNPERETQMTMQVRTLGALWLGAIAAACSSSPGDELTPDGSATGLDGTALLCVPGRSVACVGAAGCAGGQVCAADGLSYGSCECAVALDGAPSPLDAAASPSDAMAEGRAADAVGTTNLDATVEASPADAAETGNADATYEASTVDSGAPDAGLPSDAATSAFDGNGTPFSANSLCGTSCEPGTYLQVCGVGGTPWCLSSNNVNFCHACSNHTADHSTNCPTGVHAGFACTPDDSCAIVSCDPGWADCDGDAANGCEADLSSAATCGSCQTACSGTNYLCSPTGCTPTCASGLTFCGSTDGGSPKNACVDLQTSPENCGACSAGCTGQVTLQENACTAGTCEATGACLPGSEPCDGICVPNGTVTCGAQCGVDTTLDNDNCGGCGNACLPGTFCANSQCVDLCPVTYTACGGTCVQAQIDPANCGGCGQACDPGDVCAAGSCVAGASLWLKTGLGTPLALVEDATTLYWVDSSTYSIQAMPKAGGAVTTLATDQYNLLTYRWKIALDDTFIYWSAQGILRTRKDGTGAIESLTTSAGYGITVDDTNVYFAAGATTDTIYVLPKAGGTPSVFNTLGSSIDDMVSDGTFVVVASQEGPLERCPLANLGCEVIENDVTSGSLVLAGDVVYFLGTGTNEILGISYKSDPPQSVFQLTGTFSASTPGPCATRFIFSAGNNIVIDNTLVSVSLPWIASGVAPTTMVYDGQTLFWTDSSGAIGHAAIQ